MIRNNKDADSKLNSVLKTVGVVYTNNINDAFIKSEWAMLSKMIDRLVFYAFLITTVTVILIIINRSPN